MISPGYQPIEAMRKAINLVYENVGIAYLRPEQGVYS